MVGLPSATAPSSSSATPAAGGGRYLFLIPAIVMPVMIAPSPHVLGEHHPTDILGSLLFAAL
jgi:hypothetical protein